MKKNFQGALNVSISEKAKQWPQFLAVLSACLLAVGSGFQYGWPAPSVPKLLSNDMGFEVSEEEVSYVVMITPLGCLIGSPLAAFLLDRIGRKFTLLLLAIPEILPCALIATANNIYMLYIARLIMGIADGALFTTLPAYMGEVSEPKIRGIVGTSHTLGLMLGRLLINVYGSYVPITTAAYISLSMPLLFIVTFIWMPESPYYLCMKGCNKAAQKSLQALRKMHSVDDELSQITQDVKRQTSEPGSLREVFTIKSNRKGFITLIGLRTLQQFSGIVALGFYVQVIFQEAGGLLSPAEAGIVCCVAQIVVACCGSLVVDRFGRIPLLVFSSSASSFLLIAMGFYFSFQQNGYNVSSFAWFPIVGMVLYNMVSAVGMLLIPNLMAGELLSVSVKSKALCITNMYLGLCISVVSKLFHWLDHDFGMHVPFFVFAVCCILGTVFCHFCVPETKGKTLEEIQQILKGNIQKDVDSDGNNCTNRN